ncbi:MAG: alpha/beta hydrolase [Patescibacteria group bacterium]
MKQLFFVHGGDSLSPGEDFFEHWKKWKIDDPFTTGPRRKKWKDDMVDRLGADWVCAFPRFPNDMSARYAEWRWWFDKHVPYMKDGIVFVGHSLGGNFLAKYFSENTLPVQVRQIHLVAPSWSEGDLVLPTSLSRISEQCGRVYLYHSVDDPVVPFSASEAYQTALPAASFITFPDRGHFLGEVFPELVENIQKP